MTTKRIVRISYFTMLTIIGGLISIPIPFTPIKITLQTLFVAASGLILGGCDGMFAQLAYMVLGLIGLPIFSSGGGFDYVLRPSFGYILSFPLQAFLTGFLASKCRTLSSWKLFLCAFTGVLVSYAIGITYQVLIVAYYVGNGIVAALSGVPAVLLMLVKDAVLVYLLCLLYPRIKTMIGKRNETAKPPQEDTPPAPADPSDEGDKEQEKEKQPAPAPAPAPAPEPATCSAPDATK